MPTSDSIGLYAAESDRPEAIKNPTDDNLRKSGQYDPAKYKGVPREIDAGNAAGSMTFLFGVQPSCYGFPNVTALNIVDPKFIETLTRAGPEIQHSGKGPDNQRTN